MCSIGKEAVKHVILLFLLFIHNSMAGVLLEPHASINISGDAKLLGKSYSLAAIDAGIGVGYQKTWKFFKAEFVGNYSTFESETGSKENFMGRSFVLGAGLNFFNSARLFGGMVFGAQMKSSADESIYKGSGFKGELSFLIYRPWNMFLFTEYKTLTYDLRESSSGVKTKLEGDLALKVSSFALGVSFPFDLWGRQIR